MIKRKTPLRRVSKPKKQGVRGSSLNKALHKTYSDMDTSDAVCSGCGTTLNLSHSHLIARTDTELRDDPRNITYHCLPVYGRNGCSDKWELTGERATLNDYRGNMEYIREVRPNKFREMISKDYTFFENNPQRVCETDFFDYICRSFNNIKR